MSACDGCIGRSLLIAELAGWIENALAKRRALPALLSLDDDSLVDALGARRWLAQRGRRTVGPQEIRERARAEGIGTVCRHERCFPSLLTQGPDACRALYWRGDSSLLDRLEADPAVAVVGARRASAYGLEVARSLARGLSASGLVTVSGMAFGIDAAAHRGALEGGGRTIAILGSGVDVPYPARHRSLAQQIAGNGLLASEFPPGFQPRRWSFPARNRIIAGLARMTVVVEARMESGSLITAHFAQDLGRELGAVPSPVTSELGKGVNQLIVDGAVVVRDAQDVLDELYGVGVRQTRSRSPDLSDLDPQMRELLERIERGATSTEALAGTGLAVPELVGRLGELELRGLIRCDETGRFTRCL